MTSAPGQAADIDEESTAGPFGDALLAADPPPPAEQAAGSASYRPSHRRILRRIDGGGAVAPGGSLGAVVLPTIRSFDRRPPGLDLAAQLAAEQGSVLIVLCSGKARPERFPRRIRQALGSQVIVVQLPLEGTAGLPPLRSLQNPLARLWRRNDVGIKRNLGLAAAVLAGWKYLLFVDDDISPYEGRPTLDSAGLANALGAMDADPDLGAVGWTEEEFPDNSVLGHARRLAGQDQEIFISGGALLVRCDTSVPFFPSIYNEDWLFLIALVAGSPAYRNSLGLAGAVRQKEYDPYRKSRTMSEEAGDILGEGVMNLLEDDGPSLWAKGLDTSYWSEVMATRATVIKDTIGSLDALSERGWRAREAMAVALRAHDVISPEALSAYVADWKADLPTWREYLESLAASSGSPHSTVAEILTGLGVECC